MDLFIGENIKRLRRERGLTQETLAERLHISAAAVSKWERGESVPDIGMLLPLASYTIACRTGATDGRRAELLKNPAYRAVLDKYR